jgi:hypothetical protein
VAALVQQLEHLQQRMAAADQREADLRQLLAAAGLIRIAVEVRRRSARGEEPIP